MCQVLLCAISGTDGRTEIDGKVKTKRKYNNTNKRGGKQRRPEKDK
jgi:hypothetical protein